MIDFEYINPARIIFGQQWAEPVKNVLKKLDVKSMIMVYSGEFVKTLGIYDTLGNICKDLGIKFITNGNVVPNPKIELCREMIKVGKANNTDFVMAVGGGSSVDTAKTIALGILLSIIMTIVGVSMAPTILTWMGTPPDVFDLSCLYLRIYFGGFSGLIMYNMSTGILQAAGDSKHPLYYLIISSLINIVLDIAFIAVFHMGVDGAAIATVISEVFTAVLVIARLLRTPDPVRLHITKIRFDSETLKRITEYGLPTALQGSVIDISNILIQSYINSFGSLAMAGIGACTKAEGFIFLPVTAFSMAMTTYLSQNMGAGKYDRVEIWEKIDNGWFYKICRE